jgi:hypothetical protein
MKRSNTWYALILIASASLLSAASVGSGNEKHQNQTSTHNRGGEHKADHATPSFTIVVQPAPVQIIQPSPAVEQKKPQQKWYERPTVTDWGILGVTLLYALISIGLLRATKRQAKLATAALKETTVAADAARDSADAAKLALHADRPLIIVQEITMTVGIAVGQESFAPKVTFHNYGHSPAILLEAFMGLTTKSREDIARLDDTHLMEFTRHSIQKQVLGQGESLCEMITVKFVLPTLFQEMERGEKVQVAHGLIRYRGAFEMTEPYESHFCWFYIPQSGGFVIGPKELNRTT